MNAIFHTQTSSVIYIYIHACLRIQIFMHVLTRTLGLIYNCVACRALCSCTTPAAAGVSFIISYIQAPILPSPPPHARLHLPGGGGASSRSAPFNKTAPASCPLLTPCCGHSGTPCACSEAGCGARGRQQGRGRLVDLSSAPEALALQPALGHAGAG